MTEYSDFAGRLAYRLAIASIANPDIRDLHFECCRYIVEASIPIWRSTLGLERLHPEQRGTQFVWTAESSQVFENRRADIAKTGAYMNSPVRIVDETGRPFRRRLDTQIKEIPLLEELRLNGATDYVIFPLPFVDTGRTRVASFTTKSEAGFDDEQIKLLELASTILSPYAERYVLRRIAVDLLDTYVGHRSGERVFSGAIQRGTAELIEAAILMIDLRGFTRFSDEQPLDAVIATLNDFFEEVVASIDDRGGEVLKFMGDGLLAIFPAQNDAAAPSCAAALATSQDIMKRLDHLNRLRAKQGRQHLVAGLSLHVGEIAYGNFGGRLRLDFTVIGPAVNHTSRLLELAKRLDVSIVASAAFESMCGVRLPSLGLHALRDVNQMQMIFSVP